MFIRPAGTCLLAVVLFVEAGWPWADAATGDGTLQVSAELQPGQPRFIQDLPAFVSRCFPIRVPSVQKVRVVASVVSLAGFPALQGSWNPISPQNSSETGYETLDEVFDNTLVKDAIFLCVRTFSSQGCDAILTGFARPYPDKDHVPFVQLRLNYPSIWPLGGSDSPAKVGFVAKADFLEDVRLVVFPLNGYFEVKVYRQGGAFSSNASSCAGNAIKVANVSSGLLVADVHPQPDGELAELEPEVCVMIFGAGTVSINVGPRYPGPFLAPAVPHAGRLTGGICEASRILVKDGVDVTVTAAAHDASELTISAMLTADALQASIVNRWSGEVPPGGTGAALLISSSDVAAARKLTSKTSKEESISIMVCRSNSSNLSSAQQAEFWITAVTDTGVVTLKDGVAAHSSVPPRAFSDGSWKVTWREFRVLIPGGQKKPVQVSLSASSIGKVSLVADTSRHPDPTGYRWATRANTSNEVLRLTTVSRLAGHSVFWIDCRLPCFLYLAATALASDAETHVPLTVRAVLDSQGIQQLLEGEELEQMLPVNHSQVFMYKVRQSNMAVLISVSKLSGSPGFVVSSSPDFPNDATTGQADAVILLEPSAKAFPGGESPVLFIRVQSTGMRSSRFVISARSQAHAKWLLNGATAQGAVKVLRYDRYRFYVSEGEVSDNLEVAIEVIPHRGSVAIYAACDPNRYPQPSHHDWSRELASQGSLVIAATSKAFRAGWIFLTITSNHLAAYSLRVRWGDEAVKIKDGVQERGHLSPGVLRWFSLPAENQSEDQLLAVRAEALVGAFGICLRSTKQGPRRLGTPWGQGLLHWLRDRLHGAVPNGWAADLGCKFSAVANASMGVGASLAAMDVPLESFGATVELGLLGFWSSSSTANASDFVLQALLGDVITLPEDQTVIVDSLGPACCAEAPKLRRMYRHYNRFSSGSLRLFLNPLGAGRLSGAKLAVHRKGESLWFEAQEAAKERGLQLYINLKDLAGRHPGGFWLEAAVEVLRPTNFTLSLLSDFSEDLPTRLSPSVPVFDNLTEASTKYAFQTAEQVATLCLKPCYGEVRMDIASDAVQSHQDGSWHGVCTRLQSSSGTLSGIAGSAVVHKVSPLPSATYEIELATHPTNHFIELPRLPALNLAKQKLQCSNFPDGERRCTIEVAFSFDAASIGIAASGSATLRHTLIALKANPNVHADTTCGLLAALAENRSIKTVVAKDNSHHMLGALDLDEEPNSSIMVNVLVTLEDQSGAPLAAASYMPFHLTEVNMSPDTDHTSNLPVAVSILACCGLGWLLNKGFCKGHHDVREAVPGRIEMQMAYDLHEEGAASLLVQQSYVPPNV